MGTAKYLAKLIPREQQEKYNDQDEALLRSA